MNNTEPSGDADEPSTTVENAALQNTALQNTGSETSERTVPTASLERFIRVSPATTADDSSLAENDKGIPRAAQVKAHSRQLATAAARVALHNNGAEVMVLDVCDQTALFDYFVLATGTSRRQLHAISEEIDDVLQKELKDRRLGIEGYEDSRWIVLDYGSVVIHLFDEETRSYYDLESLWADATKVPLSELGL